MAHVVGALLFAFQLVWTTKTKQKRRDTPNNNSNSNNNGGTNKTLQTKPTKTAALTTTAKVDEAALRLCVDGSFDATLQPQLPPQPHRRVQSHRRKVNAPVPN